jgi:hypothetical protein
VSPRKRGSARTCPEPRPQLPPGVAVGVSGVGSASGHGSDPPNMNRSRADSAARPSEARVHVTPSGHMLRVYLIHPKRGLIQCHRASFDANFPKPARAGVRPWQPRGGRTALGRRSLGGEGWHARRRSRPRRHAARRRAPREAHDDGGGLRISPVRA